MRLISSIQVVRDDKPRKFGVFEKTNEGGDIAYLVCSVNPDTNRPDSNTTKGFGTESAACADMARRVGSFKDRIEDTFIQFMTKHAKEMGV